MGAGEVDLDGDGIPEVEWPEDELLEEPAGEEPMADEAEHKNDSWDAVVLQGNSTNYKRVVDDYAAVSALQQHSAQKQTDALWAQFLSENRAWQGIAQQIATNMVQQSQLQAQSANAFQNLILAGEVDATAQGAMSTNLANQMKSVAFETVQAAMANTAQTASVAHGGLEAQVPVELAQVLANNNSVQTALLATLAEMTKALAALTIKATGDSVTA